MNYHRNDDVLALAEAVQRIASVLEFLPPGMGQHGWAKEARVAAERVIIRQRVGPEEAERLKPGPVAGHLCREGAVTEFLEPAACSTICVGGVSVQLAPDEVRRLVHGMLAGHRVVVAVKG